MRAYHMPSLPEIPFEQFHGSGRDDTTPMKLKVLYAIDAQTNFLARSSHTVKVKTARIPIPGQNDIMTLGAVALKEALYPVMQASPELFSDPSLDYSVYVKDVSEEDEPFVGQGLASAILSKGALDEEVLVPGRVCSSFASLLTNNSSQILQIRLRLSKVSKAPQMAPPQLPQQSNATQQQAERQQQYDGQASVCSKPTLQTHQDQSKKRRHEGSVDTEDEDESKNFVEPRPIQKKPTRYVNTAPAPKAARTQSLPTFDPAAMARYPPQSIARRIYMADKTNGKLNYSYPVDSQQTSPADVSNDVSKRFAPDFISKIKSKPSTATRSNSISKPLQSIQPYPHQQQQQQHQQRSQQQQVQQHQQHHHGIQNGPSTEDNSQPPMCFHCKTDESKSWRWNNDEDGTKRGMMCYQCFNYMTTKGVMRPKKLIQRQRHEKKKREKAMTSSSPSSSSNDTVPTTTPNVTGDNKGPLGHQYYASSSDPLNEFDEMINSDLDFNLPMTDIDPFPQPAAVPYTDDKENVPPQVQKSAGNRLVSVRRASRQTSFEKMLAKSFSGAPPTGAQNALTPSDWMVDLFNNAEPTPKDQENLENSTTPRDADNTPRDITTCNTLPCNEESPEESKMNASATQMSKMKATAMPSSPLLDETRIDTSPNSMNNSDWQHSEVTGLSSQGMELPPKAHFQHNPTVGTEYTTR